ncbi:hypothetical protein RCL1_005790 [Eukaryota sp. TZLM3-RCL]
MISAQEVNQAQVQIPSNFIVSPSGQRFSAPPVAAFASVAPTVVGSLPGTPDFSPIGNELLTKKQIPVVLCKDEQVSEKPKSKVVYVNLLISFVLLIALVFITATILSDRSAANKAKFRLLDTDFSTITISSGCDSSGRLAFLLSAVEKVVSDINVEVEVKKGSLYYLVVIKSTSWLGTIALVELENVHFKYSDSQSIFCARFLIESASLSSLLVSFQPNPRISALNSAIQNILDDADIEVDFVVDHVSADIYRITLTKQESTGNFDVSATFPNALAVESLLFLDSQSWNNVFYSNNRVFSLTQVANTRLVSAGFSLEVNVVEKDNSFVVSASHNGHCAELVLTSVNFPNEIFVLARDTVLVLDQSFLLLSLEQQSKITAIQSLIQSQLDKISNPGVEVIFSVEHVADSVYSIVIEQDSFMEVVQLNFFFPNDVLIDSLIFLETQHWTNIVLLASVSKAVSVKLYADSLLKAAGFALESHVIHDSSEFVLFLTLNGYSEQITLPHVSFANDIVYNFITALRLLDRSSLSMPDSAADKKILARDAVQGEWTKIDDSELSFIVDEYGGNCPIIEHENWYCFVVSIEYQDFSEVTLLRFNFPNEGVLLAYDAVHNKLLEDVFMWDHEVIDDQHRIASIFDHHIFNNILYHYGVDAIIEQPFSSLDYIFHVTFVNSYHPEFKSVPATMNVSWILVRTFTLTITNDDSVAAAYLVDFIIGDEESVWITDDDAAAITWTVLPGKTGSYNVIGTIDNSFGVIFYIESDYFSDPISIILNHGNSGGVIWEAPHSMAQASCAVSVLRGHITANCRVWTNR